ncbi:MAG TPA: AMP-binding protein [Anaerolineales bacterium]|nr:AMP-binding protein [Anaerolineales bacterium]
MTNTEIKRDDLIRDYWGFVRQTLNRMGDKEFYVTKSGKLTFYEVNQHANIIFEAIQNITNATGLGIGLFLNDTLNIAPAMIGTLKSRDYIVPLGIDFPESTLLFMLANAGVKVILTVERYLDQIRSVAGKNFPILCLDQLDFGGGNKDPMIRYSPEDLVQILFTSGSTGQPKGAIEDYRYLGRAAFNKISNNEYGPESRILRLSAFTYSAWHTSIFGSLITGSTVCSYDIKENGIAGLPDWIRQERITNYQSSPTIFRSLISTLGPDDTFPSVHIFHAGGEKRLQKDIQDVKAHFPNVKYIYLGFASTETHAVASTRFPVDYDFQADELPSGEIRPDLTVFIRDEDGNNLPAGEEGEIVVYGDALARGYINNPELTKQRFIPDPDHPGWQYFKTGDLGKIRLDGQLVHLGRLDNMVKIRGVRIELTSIENHILSYPGVIQVASRVFEDKKGNKKIAMYFVAEEGIRVPVSDLRKYLAERLPRHLLPHYLIAIDQLPVTVSGKVVLHQLPIPEMVRPPLSNDYVAPGDELERALVAIWEEQIGVSGIGVTDDFFEVGGDSLIGVLLFAGIEEALGEDLPVSVLLIASTIREQADLIKSKRTDKSFSPIIPINADGSGAPLFFIPGKGGYPTRIRHLAKKIDIQTSIYALQDLMAEKQDPSDRSIEAAASFYLNEIKKIFPHGPYILVGESLGGKIAYEMARRLDSIGEAVPLLVLLDTYNMEEFGIDSYREDKYWMLIKKHLTILFMADWQGKLDYLRFYREVGMQKLGRFSKRRMSSLQNKLSPALPESVRRLESTNRQAVKKYRVQPYPGRVILFKALRGSSAYNPSNGWDKVALGELVIHPLDCYHGSVLFEPAVGQVAKILQGYIDDISNTSQDTKIDLLEQD